MNFPLFHLIHESFLNGSAISAIPFLSLSHTHTMLSIKITKGIIFMISRWKIIKTCSFCVHATMTMNFYYRHFSSIIKQVFNLFTITHSEVLTQTTAWRMKFKGFSLAGWPPQQLLTSERKLPKGDYKLWVNSKSLFTQKSSFRKIISIKILYSLYREL
jgi:hypothetical protein